jgi:hypothetical protein
MTNDEKQTKGASHVIRAPADPDEAELGVAVLKGIFSLVPGIGPLAAELAGLYLNPLEPRKQAWIAEVSSALNEIKERFALLPESLQSNEAFISFLYQATTIALKNHQREKIRALRNALVSVATPPGHYADDAAFQFLRYIDELTPTHLTMLACFDKHAGQFARETTLETVYEKLCSFCRERLDRGLFRSFLTDLNARLLVLSQDLDDLPEFASRKDHLLLESSATRPLQVTALGRSFLSFIEASATA